MGDVKVPPLNELVIAGRIARDPEHKQLPSGATVCSSCICNTQWTKGRDGEKGKEKPTFIDVKAFNMSADILAKYAKGRPVILCGRIEQENWTDKTTGANRSKLVLIANEISALDWDAKPDDPGAYTPTRAPQPQTSPDDDIPF